MKAVVTQEITVLKFDNINEIEKRIPRGTIIYIDVARDFASDGEVTFPVYKEDYAALN